MTAGPVARNDPPKLPKTAPPALSSPAARRCLIPDISGWSCDNREMREIQRGGSLADQGRHSGTRGWRWRAGRGALSSQRALPRTTAAPLSLLPLSALCMLLLRGPRARALSAPACARYCAVNPVVLPLLPPLAAAAVFVHRRRPRWPTSRAPYTLRALAAPSLRPSLPAVRLRWCSALRASALTLCLVYASALRSGRRPLFRPLSLYPLRQRSALRACALCADHPLPRSQAAAARTSPWHRPSR